MAISFDLIPINLRTPGVYAEFDSTRALQGLIGVPFKTLMVGQKLAGGSQAVDTLVRVVNDAHAQALFGRGSMLHRMAIRYFANNRTVELWAVALADAGGAQAAAGNILFSGSITASGTLFLYIAGQRLTIGVASTDTPANVATAVAAAITAALDLPVTAAVNGVTPEQVDLTARHAGEAGNSIDIRLNYFDGEESPAGLAATITPMAAGTANPDITPAIAAAGEEWFTVWAMPYTDAANLTILEDELDDRWGPMRSIEGVAFAMRTGTLSSLLTFGDGRNSPFVSMMGVQGALEPPWEWSAAICGQVAFSAQNDPVRPFQTLELVGLLPPDVGDRFIQSERDQLLRDGIATFTVDAASDDIRIERLITMYQENPSGIPDISYLDVNTIYTLGYIRFSVRARFLLRFPRHKLADDGVRFGPGSATVTPKIAKGEILALAGLWLEGGIIEDLAQFKADLVVERNGSDPNRLDVLMPPNIVNQLRIAAFKIQFIL